MVINLYTLPNCGICHMIKSKMQLKNIQFNELDFNEIAEKLKINQAPVLEIVSDINIHENPMHVNADYVLSPIKMVEWINQYKEQ